MFLINIWGFVNYFDLVYVMVEMIIIFRFSLNVRLFVYF